MTARPPVLSAPAAPVVSPAQARGWSLRLVAALYGLTGLLLLLNVLVDPFQVFGLLSLRDSYGPNELFNKYRHLVAHPTRHDAFFVGSSRMGAFEPATAERLRPGRRYYNLAALGSRPADQLALLQALHAAGVVIREVVVGLELYPFVTPRPADALTYRLPPEATGESPLAFYLAYAWQVDYQRLLTRLVHHVYHDAPQMHFDFTGTGRYRLEGMERARAADPEGYRRRYVPAVTDVPRPATPPHWLEPAFADLVRLRDWLQAQGITAVYFVHPFHPGDLAQVAADAPGDFVRRLEQLLPEVRDFSHAAPFLDSRDYYDYKHYTPGVADGILQALFAPADRGAAPAAAVPAG